MRVGWKRLGTALLGTLVCLSGVIAQAQVTPFGTDVSQAIDDGLAWLDAQGAFNNPSSASDGTGLTLLALLDKRESADISAESQGYGNASAADQARMRTTVEYILNQINIQGSSGFYAYRDGAYLMALGRYMRSGGPEIGGAPLTLVDAYNIVFDRTAANQAASGYWCYTTPFCDDSSTTQLVMAGLAAARGVYGDAAFADAARLASVDTLAANARAGYIANGKVGSAVGDFSLPGLPEFGHGYNAGPWDTNSLQQTASGTWIQLVGGADLNDASVQGYLRWIYNRYRYSNINVDGIDGYWSGLSYAYYLWSSSKAYNFMNASSVAPSGSNLTPASLGTLPPADAPAYANRQLHRDPTTDPRVARFGAGGAGFYAAESQDWYYDYAYTLLSLQDAAGRFQPPSGDTYWDPYASQAYAILVLQRSVGGGCIDSDGDGVCDDEDNCVNTPNPDQADRDEDGIGDVCDNCPDVFNPGQEDSNGDGIGDACEVAAMVCDVEPDGDVDRSDIRTIMAARNNPASGPDDPMDANGDGMITALDGKLCIQQCTLPRCASPPP